MESTSQLGITTEEALKKLHNAIDDELNKWKCKEKSFSSVKRLLVESYSDDSIASTFGWPSILLLSSCTIIYSIAYICGHFTTSIPIIIYGIVLILVLFLNIALMYWNTKQTHREMHEKTQILCKQIKLCYNNERLIECWKSLRYYPHLYTPQSPCISLQWTYRDGKRVNLPTPLLVEGDVILLCPGHTAPAKCHNIEYMSSDHYYCNDSESPNQLNSGELFVPTADFGSDAFTVPRLRKAVKPVKFVLLETPFIDYLKTIFVENLTKKPATTFEKELHTIMSKYILKILIPIVWLIIMLVGSIHYGYLESIGSDSEVVTWPASLTLLLLRPVMAILPLMPLTLPLTWLAFNSYGLARLMQICESNSESQNVSNIQGSPGSILTGSNIGRESDKKKNNEFYLEELDSDQPSVPLIKTSFSFYDLLIKIRGLLLSKDGNLWRTANLLQVLGSITALCCVDKKGILSWPNPTVDKVFFMSSQKAHNDNNDTDMKDHKSAIKSHSHPKKDKRLNKNSIYSYTKSDCIQLDITHDPHNAYGLQFDDPEWQKHLSNLKPLGLGILLNTCNQESQEEFIQFCDHVSCESLHNEAAVPVVNKRCVCELARQIGFTENASKGYVYNCQIALFRHVRPEVIQKGKLAKSLNFPRLKMPFPNMTCAVIKDIYTNTDQLFSQGTGDLVLDACTEYWDGQDLCVLTDSDRKKILDFYHRSSLTSYCSAFAYVPLTNYDINVSFNDCYIELPPDSSHLFPSQKSLDSSLRSSEHHLHNVHIFSDPITKSTLLSHHLSSDSLIKQDHGVLINSSSNRPKSSDSNQSYDNYHIDLLMHQISNEVFIGMTTLQYQACSDFVQLVEQLETACIRFVHFSKENELRSRVFSEKMGLESGWNCHISLLNDEIINETNYATNSSAHHYTSASKGSKSSLMHESQTITNYVHYHRSQSAPNSVNLELSTVKFADDCDLEISDNDINSQSDSDSQLNVESNVDEDGKSSRRWSKGESNLSPSPSRLTASTGTENSVPIAFDMSNRAKLPKGIENIRPHLESVDNVPLLVSLFTDCNPEVTKEMIAIMQEYGEVVCVIGSSANILNVPIFLQSDASIGVEPMYPQVCITEPIKEADGFIESLPENFICPTDLARQLITLPCSLSLFRQNAIIFYQLITEAKHYMMKMKNSFEFLFSACLTITLTQLLSSLVFLPPLLSPGLVLWLVCVVLPILSFSLMGTKDNNDKISIATAKNLSLNKQIIYNFVIYYIIKFLPSVLISLLCFGFIIGYSCQSINIGISTAGPCWMFSDVKANGDINTDIMWSSHLLIGQTITSILLVLFLTVISAGYVHHNQLLWQRSPLRNRWWLFISIALFICHSIVCIVEVYVYVPNFAITTQFIAALPVYVWCVSLLWPLLILSINTLAKKREIKMFLRQQRRARLEFGTKLGMNSPF